MADKERSEKDIKLDKAIRMLTLMVANSAFRKVTLHIEAGTIVRIEENTIHKL
jgi:hypothetical protein